MAEKYHCSDCDEDVAYVSSSRAKPICVTCGGNLTKVAPAPAAASGREQSLQSLEDLFELLGADLRDAIQESMALSQPMRHISVDYLSTLGKIIVDDKKTILRDISLAVGPLTVLAVSAHFGFIPPEPSDVTCNVVCGFPTCGETALTNGNECKGAAVLLDRGVVSFANKTLRAIEAGASAVLIAQTAGVWPFFMADSAGEIAASGKEIAVPVVMVSQKDAGILRQLVREQPGLRATLKVGHAVHECSICQDAFEIGASVLKLPCRHVYHTDCVTNWLRMNNTCPLCRLELPKETDGKVLKAASAAPRNVDPSRMYYN
jgi:hypothetical protein